jgi:hypothetical protein
MFGGLVQHFRKILAVFALATASPASAETMSQQAVIALVKAGLSDELVIAKINSESCNYDVTTDSILSLKVAGLSDRVITAMVVRCATASQTRGIAGDDTSPDPMVRHSPGIYVMADWQRPSALQRIHIAKSSGTKSSGNGSIVFPLSVKLVMPSASSQTPISANNPTFYFYFNRSDSNVSDFGQEQSLATQSADEFSLIKFSKNGETREIEIHHVSGLFGPAGSGRTGFSPKSTMNFTSEDKGNGIFRVSVNSLEPGEYAFVFTKANVDARIYDFTILQAAPLQNR